MPWIDITDSLIPFTPASCPGNLPGAPVYELQGGGFWRATPNSYPPGAPDLCTTPGPDDTVPPGYAARNGYPGLLYTGPDIADVPRFRIKFQFPEPASSHDLYSHVSESCGGALGCWYLTVLIDGNNCVGCNPPLDPNNTTLQVVEVEAPSVVWQDSTAFGAYIQFQDAHTFANAIYLCADIYSVEVWSDVEPERFWTNFVGCQEL